jgi:Tfp pilus assembly protein PilX
MIRNHARIPDTTIEESHERGSALIAVLLLLMMLSGLAAALGMSGRTETLISRNQRSAAQATAAAEAGLNHAVELATTYIFEWKANGLTGPEQAVDYLLIGADLATGTVATDADNGSLATRNGIAAAESIPIGAHLTITAGIDAEYEAFVMDDDATAPDEPANNLFDDENQTLIVRSIGYAENSTKVVLEALIAPLELGAVVVNGDFDVSGNVTIDGAEGSVHANGDLVVSGGSASVAGTTTASGSYTGGIPGTGGAPELPVPEVRASDYLAYADFILTSGGTMTNQMGTVLCAATPCNNWSFNSGSGEWSFNSTAPTTGTYYVEGDVSVTGSPGSAASPVQITIIAEGSIDISGSPDVTSHTPELLFVTDGDLEISGGLDAGNPLTASGQILVHEQVKLSGNPSIAGQLIVENAASVSTLVTANDLSGHVTITYNGGLGGGTFSVRGWRDVRDAN